MTVIRMCSPGERISWKSRGTERSTKNPQENPEEAGAEIGPCPSGGHKWRRKYMKRAFPVLIKKNDDAFLVFVPDLEIYTEGKDMADAIAMARDAIGARGVTMEDMGQEIPEASTVEEAVSRAKKDADEIFDYSDGIITFVDVDLAAYRSRL